MTQYSPEGTIPVHPSVRDRREVKQECPLCHTPFMRYHKDDDRGNKVLRCRRGHVLFAKLSAKAGAAMPRKLRPSQRKVLEAANVS